MSLDKVGNYKVVIGSSKTKEVPSRVLPINGGIKIYPLRFGIFEKKKQADGMLLHWQIAPDQNDSDKFKVQPQTNTPLEGTGHYFDNIYNGDLYRFYPTPLRDGWLYVVSKNMNAIYEYKHQNYLYCLFRFFKANSTQSYEKINTTRQHCIHCAESDEIYMFYSDFRLEEAFLRSRFFEDGKVRLTRKFEATKWLNKSDIQYKTNIEQRRASLNNSYIVLDSGENNNSSDYYDVLEKIADGLNESKSEETRETIAQRNLFFIIDDPIGVAASITNNIHDWHIQQQALLYSIKTGIAQDEIYYRICDNPAILTNGSIDNLLKEKYPTVDISNTESMNTMALLLKTFFIDYKYKNYGSEAELNMRKYIIDCKKELNPEMIDGILGLKLRKEVCRQIDLRRATLLDFFGSPLFRRYCYLFLDKEEIDGSVPNEADLPFVIPAAYRYDFKKEGSVYNFMLCSLRDIIYGLYNAAKYSPYQSDILFAKEKDSFLDRFPDILKPTLTNENEQPKSIIIKIMTKEVVPQEYFDDKQKAEVVRFSEKEDFDFWSFSSISYTSIITLADGYILRKSVPMDITFDLLPDKNGEITATSKDKPENSKNNKNVPKENIQNPSKGIRHSIERTNGEGYLIRTTDMNGNIKDSQIKIKNSADVSFDTRNRFVEIKVKEANVRGWNKKSITVFGVMVEPKADWAAAKNFSGKAEYCKTRGSLFLQKYLNTPMGGAVGIMLGGKLFLNAMVDPDRPQLRKVNDIAMFAFAIGASSELFMTETFLNTKINNPFYRLNKVSRRIKITETMTKASVFRAFVVLGNITEGLDGIIEGDDLINRGNVIVGNISFYSGFILVLSPLFIAIPTVGWAWYLILTISLIVLKYIAPFFKDSDFKIFIETTIFYKQQVYAFKYLNYTDVLEASQYIHTDLKTLLQKDAKTKRKNVLASVETFKHQLDELLMTHLFTPSINDFRIDLGYVKASLYQKIGETSIDNFPESVSLSFSVNFALLIDRIETVDLEIFYSLDANPPREQLQPLAHRAGISEDILYINGKPQTQESLPSQWVLLDPAQDKIKYEQGMLAYLYKLIDYEHGSKKSSKELLTAPFFLNSPYYIFVYLRFKLKDRGWMPADRNGAEAYHISRFKIAAVPDYSKSKMYEAEIVTVKQEINNKPDYENFK